MYKAIGETSLSLYISLFSDSSISLTSFEFNVALAITCVGKNSLVINATHIKAKSLFLLLDYKVSYTISKREVVLCCDG